MKKKIRVTIEKEIEIDLPDTMLTPEYRAEFEQGLWDYESDDELFFYAARMAAEHGGGNYDGLGRLDVAYATFPCAPEVKFSVIYEDVETELAD